MKSLGKLSWLTALPLALVFTAGYFVLGRSGDREKKQAEQARLELRKAGFKTELAGFDFSTSEELRAREAALFRGINTFGSPLFSHDLDLMTPLGPDAAVAVWTEENQKLYEGEGFWAHLRESLAANQETVEAVRVAASAGPISFNLEASHGHGMLLKHLPQLKNLSQSLSQFAVLQMLDHHRDEAWKNLLACTRLVTAWQPEPAEVSHLVRFSCATIMYETTWQLLQDKGWSDDQLAGLQREWESVDFFRGLPDVAAFARACALDTCRQEREQPQASGLSLMGFVRSPLTIGSELKYYWSQRRYPNHGSYEDEKALLLFYRDQELQMSHAVRSPNWSAMRALPGVTNTAPFRSKYRSRMQTVMNMKEIGMAHARQAGGLLGRAAAAETRRRILLAAIALERHRQRHGSYPPTLQNLTPQFLKSPPSDFMDGQPLRYRLGSDGTFVLYSVGLDCIDHDGRMTQRPPSGLRAGFASQQEFDLVWPRPASADEIEILHQAQVKALAEQDSHNREDQAAEQWDRTARHQAGAEKLLAAQQTTRQSAPDTRRLADLFPNEKGFTSSQVTLDQLLALKQIITGDEPETATFEVPVSYDVLTNLGGIALLIDPTEDEDSDRGFMAEMFECKRAANGLCHLVWQTIYETPGRHALQLGLRLNNPLDREKEMVGPLAPFVVSNLCQFSVASTYFNPRIGATLHAKLPEPNGIYTLEITSGTGHRLKTISGSTSNGIIRVDWDLRDDQGGKLTNLFFNSLLHLTLPDSGRKQTMKGP